MRILGVFLLALLTGCHASQPPEPPKLPEPADFANWPSVTEKPVQIGPALWRYCRGPTPEETKAQEVAAKRSGPHANYSIVVRVSPDAITAFREGKPLPVGATVIKEKYATKTMEAYGVMIKREPGYNPDAGDWEYAYVRLAGDREVTRGRMAECIGCHEAARGTDFLYRVYGR